MGIRIYRVVGDSMSPSFKAGELLVVNEMTFKGDSLRRGDVVIAIDPRCGSRYSLKRVVGLPGEQVSLADGILWIDGDYVREPYLRGTPPNLGLDENKWHLARGEYFVMGDNRAHSSDSRTYGPVSSDLIIGKAAARIWPLGKIGRL